MKQNPLRQLQEYGQSVWYDNISRGLIASGELQRLITEEGVRGVTSNPTIFEKAINAGTDYDKEIHAFTTQGKEPGEIMDALTVRDIQLAADLFQPVFQATQGGDGFVSIEVSPTLAADTAQTVAAARRLHRLVNRKNVFVKVPATPAGIPAIEQLLGEGININSTLIFSLERYEAVMNAYLNGLERLARAGKPLGGVASVASFFVSRVDTLVDALLEQRLQATTDPGKHAVYQTLLGKAAIANAKQAYQQFLKIFEGPRFEALKRQGARVQRPLWASTSAKNPRYRDVAYVEELIGADTVNTMPQATLLAFRDHGKVRPSLEERPENARMILQRLGEVGIDMRQVTQQLEDEGVRLFEASYEKLLQSLAAKREMFRAGGAGRQSTTTRIP